MSARRVVADAMYRHDEAVIDDARTRSRFSREKADRILRGNSDEIASVTLSALHDAGYSVVKLERVEVGQYVHEPVFRVTEGEFA